jgi:molecular chaperone DnaK (HSP70)
LADAAEVLDMTDVVLGIDFGTSCTSAGALVGDRVELVRDNTDPVIPTVIYVPDRGEPEIGRRALLQVASTPTKVVRSVKRVLGLHPSDELVRRYITGTSVRIDAVGDRLAFKLGGREWAAEQLAAAVLVRVRDLAESRFGGRISRCVITMSAGVGAAYRDAIVRAAKIARLEVLELVAEPIAGALAVGMHADSVARRLLVLDFGGGTFDASAIVQQGMRFSPLAACGDPLLGGDDFDDALAEGVAGAVYRTHKIDLHRDLVKWSELRLRCEAAKRALSARHDVRLAMPDAFVVKGRPQPIDCTVDRKWAEERWAPLFERAQLIIEEALRRAGWTADLVDRVALIGGTSLVPRFQQLVGAQFGAERVVVSPDADLAVAMGAALLTARHGATPRHVPVLDATSARAPAP